MVPVADTKNGVIMDKAEVIQAIKTTLLRRGEGTKDSPIRTVTQYWDFDGNLLIEKDPNMLDGFVEEIGRIKKLLDELEKANGDAPHRGIDICTRIQVLANREFEA